MLLAAGEALKELEEKGMFAASAEEEMGTDVWTEHIRQAARKILAPIEKSLPVAQLQDLHFQYEVVHNAIREMELLKEEKMWPRPHKHQQGPTPPSAPLPQAAPPLPQASPQAPPTRPRALPAPPRSQSPASLVMSLIEQGQLYDENPLPSDFGDGDEESEPSELGHGEDRGEEEKEKGGRMPGKMEQYQRRLEAASRLPENDPHRLREEARLKPVLEGRAAKSRRNKKAAQKRKKEAKQAAKRDRPS